jgi:predicted short-subunit dehydrogenase-like oxidoreductase (DUF2520 family)
VHRVRVVGRGRAGGALTRALRDVGWSVEAVSHELARPAARDVDVAVLAVPDGEITQVARAIEPVDDVVVAHMAGSLTLEVLTPHARRASFHPLVALPNAELGAELLQSGIWFAVAGDPVVRDVVHALGGRTFEVDDANRVAYHAAAVIASNHVVALLGQAERVAATAGVPLEVYLDLVRATVENVATLGPARALTGPAARGDDATIALHLEALDPDERTAYEALVEQCRRLVG